ncbi:MAG: hypothetical protein HRT35_28710 [Algicola sp.]|nr:hypothetical protein [Algicola sp.]
MQFFPIYLDTTQTAVLVVGGGEAATRKVELMLKTAAKVTVVSPQLSPALTQLHQQNHINHIAGTYQKSQLKDKQLVFVAADDNELNKIIREDARHSAVLVNVVDSPTHCDFITPSIVDRSPLTFAICSEGQSPVLVRYWRARLEALVPQGLGLVARFAGEKRQQVRQLLDSITKRRNFWEHFFSSKRSEDLEQAKILFDQLIGQQDNDQPVKGELYVVTAPDHPDFLTLVALRNMQKADIALYDNTVSPLVLELIRRDSERELVDDQNIEAKIDTYIKQGLRVCYLSTKPK